MKVLDIERMVVDVPFTPRQQKITQRSVYNWSILELCKVTTDSGHVGWGETGGGKSAVLRQGSLSAEAQMPFWLQLVGNGLTTTWAAHLGSVLTHATWPTISCINLYTHHLLKEGIQVTGGYQKVPDGPGLGVEVDEEAVEQHRVPREKLDDFREKGQLYSHPRPRLINTVVYPDGNCVHMAELNTGYFDGGSGLVYAEGVRVESWPDDGSSEWAELFERVQESPVRGHWQGHH